MSRLRPPWQAVALQHLEELRGGVEQQKRELEDRRRELEDRRERQDLRWIAALAIVLGASILSIFLAVAAAVVGLLL